MSASQILLAGHGHEDQWLSDNPNRTYFEAKYQPKVNRSRETYEIPFDNQVTFDSTGRCTIPVKGDYMTRMTLRTVMPPIYPTVPGQYVFPTPSSQVGGTVYVNKNLSLVVADGVTLTANTVGNHYFSIGAQVTLAGTAYVIFDLDGTYTITGIPTANSFTCSTTLAGISYNGTVSSPGIQCGDIISYFSTANSNLWVNNVTNKTWQITNAIFNQSQTELTLTTSSSSGFSVGQQVNLLIKSIPINEGNYTVISSTDTTFTVQFSLLPKIFVSLETPGGVSVTFITSTDGQTWTTKPTIYGTGLSYLAFGNGALVATGYYGVYYSLDYGETWNSGTKPGGYFFGVFENVAFGKNTFTAFHNYNYEIWYSETNGETWLLASVPVSDTWYDAVYGNDTFVAIGQNYVICSADEGKTWTSPTSAVGASRIEFGNNTFIRTGTNIYHSTNGVSWTLASSVPANNGSSLIAFGNNTFVTVTDIGGYANVLCSTTNGVSWTSFPVPNETWNGIAYGNGRFVLIGTNTTVYSEDDGVSWSVPVTLTGAWSDLLFTNYTYYQDPTDLVTLVVPPIVVNTTQTQFTFLSNIYPSMSFGNSTDAAFWGFDFRNGLTYSFPVTPPWTFTQGGWIAGFLPPSTSTWDDSVAHKLCKAVRVLVGKQTIKEYSGEYIELQNDLLIPYENKAILKLMNGTLDQTQATVSREYYVNLPLGTKEIPLCALTHQHMSVEVDFDSYLNLSQNLNQGTGDFLDAKSYLTYDASTGNLGGQPVNVQTTFSYQQYIFIVTYGGQFIIFDTTKNVDDPASYIVLSAFSGSSLFSQFCVLSGNLYIGLTDGQLVRGIIDELIQGNTSSLELNSYTPTIGSLTGTIVADFRYVYYTVSNTVTSNVFFSRFDTTGSFTNPGSYTTFNFTSNIDSTATSVYQFLTTGSQLVALTNTPGKFYIFSFNGDFTASWNSVDYSLYTNHITNGVLIGNTLYFTDGYNIIIYSNDGMFKNYTLTSTFVAVGGTSRMYSANGGEQWNYVQPSLGAYTVCFGNQTFVTVNGSSVTYSNDGGRTWEEYVSAQLVSCYAIAFGNGIFVTVGYYEAAYSNDNAQTWISSGIQPNVNLGTIAFGNNTFVAFGSTSSVYSLDNGQTWSDPVSMPVLPQAAAFGNGTFVVVGYNDTAYSLDNGQTWKLVALAAGNLYGVAFGNDTFVAVGEKILYSTDNGQSWLESTPFPGLTFRSVSFGNGTFVAVRLTKTIYSTDGITWTDVTVEGYWYGIAFGDTGIVNIPGDGLQNLHAVGSKIYASSNSSTVSSVIEIDTSQDLNSPAAYKYYSSTDSTAPITFTGTAPMIFTNGPRYVYMFAQGNNTATNIVEFDPYGPDQTFKASILVDYESLPPEVPRPNKALLGLVQTQKVTDMTQMNIKGPVKELWVTGVSATTNVFQYSNLATLSTLELAGEQIVTDDDGTHTFLNVIEPFETHTSMPIRNVSVVSFEFDPESEIPNGTVNFSRIRDQIFDGGAETVWARTYNLLAIQGGIGNLMYN